MKPSLLYAHKDCGDCGALCRLFVSCYPRRIFLGSLHCFCCCCCCPDGIFRYLKLENFLISLNSRVCTRSWWFVGQAVSYIADAVANAPMAYGVRGVWCQAQGFQFSVWEGGGEWGVARSANEHCQYSLMEHAVWRVVRGRLLNGCES